MDSQMAIDDQIVMKLVVFSIVVRLCNARRRNLASRLLRRGSRALTGLVQGRCGGASGFLCRNMEDLKAERENNDQILITKNVWISASSPSIDGEQDLWIAEQRGCLFHTTHIRTRMPCIDGIGI